MLPIEPWRVKIEKQKDRIIYKVDMGDQPEAVFDHTQMFHIPAYSYDGVVGLSAVQANNEAIGGGLAAQQFANRFYASDGNVTTVLRSDQALGDDQYERLKEEWKKYEGLTGENGTPILEGGFKLESVNVPIEDAQVIEARKFSVQEVGRMFKCPPPLIASLENTNYSNLSEINRIFATHTMQPWTVKWQEEADRKLLLNRERGEFKTEFIMNSLLRADHKTRAQFYKVMVHSEIMTRNEVRELENLNPKDGGNKLEAPTNSPDPTGETQPKDEDNE
jgi:HK97 family phage portal protein